MKKTQEFGTRVRRDFMTLFILYIITAIMIITNYTYYEDYVLIIIGFRASLLLCGYILAKKQIKAAGYLGIGLAVISIIGSIISFNIISVFDLIISGSLLLHCITYLKNYDNQEQYK